MTGISYWQFFRLIFVVFFLYLMGDAFYRWDGFRYYASFPDFVLSVSLAAVMLSIIAAIVTLLIWLPYTCLEWFSLVTGRQGQKKIILLFLMVFLSGSTATWVGKRLLLPLLSTTLQTKIAVLICVFFVAIFVSWFFRDSTEKFTKRISQLGEDIQNRITPLVWIFGIFVILSMPVVIYQTWFTDTDSTFSGEVIRPSVMKKKRPNFILVTFDAMSARNMSLYGYKRETTPFITKWAKTATVFTRAEAESNFTAPTTSSLMTGKRVWSHLRFSRMQGSPPIKMDTESLPVVLKNNGYTNMAFMVNIITSVNNLGVAGSFDIAPHPSEFMVTRNIVRTIHKATTSVFSDKFKIYNWFFQDGFITAKLFQRIAKDFDETSYPPEKAFNKLIRAIDYVERPFFAWVHLNPPHAPYLPPKPYKGMFDASEKMRTIKSQLIERNNLLAYKSLHKRFPAGLETLKARYDEFIRYCDDQFKGFIGRLEKKGKLKDTVIILSTDHGEIFDHNHILHGDSLYEPETHIPLVIKEPYQTESRSVVNLVEQIDISATILDLADIPIPSWMEGRSLVPHMRGEEMDPRPAFAMNVESSSSRERQITKGTIAMWDSNYKMIHNLEKKESMLFNLRHDPGELNNIIITEPEVSRRLLNLIYENLNRANERISKGN